jgi:hypothetical protein
MESPVNPGRFISGTPWNIDSFPREGRAVAAGRERTRGSRRTVAESAFTQFDQQGRQRVVTAEQGVGINPFVSRLDNGRI